MKNTSCIKMLALSLSFATMHFAVSPMSFGNEILSSEDQSLSIKYQIANSLAEQRISSWWKSLSFGSGESVESFFNGEPKQDVFEALFELGEYGHAVFVLGNFLNKSNEDISKKIAKDIALNFAIAGKFPAINLLVDWYVGCYRKSPQLMSFNSLNSMVSLIILGMISIQTAYSQMSNSYDVEDIKIALDKKYKSLLKEFIGLVGSEKTLNEYYQEQFKELVPLINKKLWHKSSSLWITIASIDCYGKISFVSPMQDEIAEGEMKSAKEIVQSMMDINIGPIEDERMYGLEDAIAILDTDNIEDFLKQE